MTPEQEKLRKLGRPTRFGELLNEWQNTARFNSLSKATQYHYVHLLGYAMPLKLWPLEDITKADLLEVAKLLHNRPTTHNCFIQLIRQVFTYAERCGYIEESPSKFLKRLRLTGYIKPFDLERLQPFLDNATRGGVYLAAAVAYYTGQRISDVLAMKWDDIKDGKIVLEQGKTKRKLVVHLHQELLDILARSPRTSLTIVGGLKDRLHATREFKAACERFNVHYTPFHGIRKLTASTLAERGASIQQIQAVTGHRTLREIIRYTRDAKQATMNKEAIGLL